MSYQIGDLVRFVRHSQQRGAERYIAIGQTGQVAELDPGCINHWTIRVELGSDEKHNGLWRFWMPEDCVELVAPLENDL